jgi:hypothetical protein
LRLLLREEECGDYQLSQASTAPESAIRVRLRIFSGRPDPEWALRSNGIDEMARRARAGLGTQRVPAPPEENLGYRGFELRGGRSIGLPDDLVVFGGVISDRSEKTGAHWIDGAGLEEFLLDEARQRGFADLLEAGGAPRSPR